MIGADAPQPDAQARDEGTPTVGPVHDLLDAVAAPLVLVDGQGRLVRANRAFHRALGGEAVSVGATLTDLLGPLVGADERRLERDQHPLHVALRTRTRQGPVRVGFHGPEGARRWADLSVEPRPADQLLLTLIDRTAERALEVEGKVLQARLDRADRRATAGTLAGAVAHEIKNHLVPALYALDELAEAIHRPWTETHATEERLDEAQTAVRMAAEIARDLLDFCRDDERPALPVSVNAAVESALRMARAELRQHAHLTVELGDLPLVEAHPGRLVQVVLNLVLNAVRAIQELDQGRRALTVRTQHHGDQIAIRVTDAGCGIQAADLSRLFEPHFTRRHGGAGGGLGLTVCERIVTAHGGRIEVESVPDQGATFTVLLPVSRGEPMHAMPSPLPGTVAPLGRPRVLLVEDQLTVRRALIRMLGRAFDVVPAGGVTEALELLQRSDDFGLVLSDLTLLDGTAIDLHAWLTAHRPDLLGRLAFMTGGVFAPTVRDFLADHDFPWLEKPFRVQQVLDLYGDLTGADPRAP